MLRSFLQTYDHYLDRSYKGLDADQKVEVHKATMGKVGVAMSYKDIRNE